MKHCGTFAWSLLPWKKCAPFAFLMCICYCQQYNEYWKHCHGNATMCSIYCGTPYVTVNNTKHTYTFTCTSQCLIFWYDINCSIFFWEIFIEVPNIKFHENPSSGSCTYTHRQKEKWTDMMWLIGVFAIVNAPRNWDTLMTFSKMKGS